jgi:hypothetical protein
MLTFLIKHSLTPRGTSSRVCMPIWKYLDQNEGGIGKYTENTQFRLSQINI